MKKLLIVFVVLLLIDILIPIMTNFLSIKVESYLNYLLWINALGVFYAILPERKGEMFSN